MRRGAQGMYDMQILAGDINDAGQVSHDQHGYDSVSDSESHSNRIDI